MPFPSVDLRLIQALAQLRKVATENRRLHHVLDAGVDLVENQGDHAFLPQKPEAPMGRGEGHIIINDHRLQLRDFLFGMQDRAEQVQQPLLHRVSLGEVRQLVDRFRQV
jgi:hypothetical protein